MIRTGGSRLSGLAAKCRPLKSWKSAVVFLDTAEATSRNGQNGATEHDELSPWSIGLQDFQSQRRSCPPLGHSPRISDPIGIKRGIASGSFGFSKGSQKGQSTKPSDCKGIQVNSAGNSDKKRNTSALDGLLPRPDYKSLKKRWEESQKVPGWNAKHFSEYDSNDEESTKEAAQLLRLKPSTLANCIHALKRFQAHPETQDKARILYVSSKAYHSVSVQFVRFMLQAMNEEEMSAICKLPGPNRRNALFPIFAEYVVDQHREEVRSYREVVHTLDLSKPHLWYPLARSIKRKLIYHAGPTNSGKTYSALQALMQAGSGVYCGPLRLLAMEVYDSCNISGTYCSLITGQERKIVEGAQHTSCTLEMVNVNEPYDVAVIDEIQMLGDKSRGWAWTRALQGVAAKEVHLCGDPSAAGLVKKLAEEMGEEVEMKEYERFLPMKIEKHSLKNGWADIRAGDCVVAFSRKKIYEIKNVIEAMTGLRACLVYGALPPETRRNQARDFNNDDNEFEIMVASDAIGMGLNLNIRRVIFASMHKMHQGQPAVISQSEIKQIAGRAGRRSSQYKCGFATCFRESDMPILRSAFKKALEPIAKAGLLPLFEHLEAYAGQSLQTDLASILQNFEKGAKMDSKFFFCQQESILQAEELLQRVPNLSLADRYNFCVAPLKVTDPRQAAILLHFAATYAENQQVILDFQLPQNAPKSPEDLVVLEALHQVAGVWLWLSHKFGKVFPNQAHAEEVLADISKQLDVAIHEVLPNTGKQVSKHATLLDLQKRKAAILQATRPYLRQLCPTAMSYFKSETKKMLEPIIEKLQNQEQALKERLSSDGMHKKSKRLEKCSKLPISCSLQMPVWMQASRAPRVETAKAS